MKIVTIIGARPQFIKASALSREFRRHPEIEEILVHTGQHFDSNISGIFFSKMQIFSANLKLLVFKSFVNDYTEFKQAEF
jgi:UDP-GlcNAc3NAcA epimerase